LNCTINNKRECNYVETKLLKSVTVTVYFIGHIGANFYGNELKVNAV